MEKLKKKTLLIFWVSLVILSVSCTSQPKQEAIFPLEVRLEVAKQILADNAKLVSIVEVCALYGEAVKKKSEDIQRQWHQNNWSFVQLGFTEYQNYFHKRIMEVGEVPSYLDAFYLILQAQEEKRKPISHVVETYTQKHQICDDLLFDYGVGKKDVKQNAHHLKVIMFLMSLHAQRSSLSPRTLPEINGMVNPSRYKGISRYGIEKQVKESICPQGEVINMIDHWPEESYGIYCPNQNPKALICKWGKCQWLDDYSATLKEFLHDADVKQ